MRARAAVPGVQAMTMCGRRGSEGGRDVHVRRD